MAGFLTGAMAVLVFLQVLFRYVLDAPLDWSEEMSTFAFAWMCLLGASVGLRYDQHPRLDILLILFPPPHPKKCKSANQLFYHFYARCPVGLWCQTDHDDENAKDGRIGLLGLIRICRSSSCSNDYARPYDCSNHGALQEKT
jgi:hypothetical protein